MENQNPSEAKIEYVDTFRAEDVPAAPDDHVMQGELAKAAEAAMRAEEEKLLAGDTPKRGESPVFQHIDEFAFVAKDDLTTDAPHAENSVELAEVAETAMVNSEASVEDRIQELLANEENVIEEITTPEQHEAALQELQALIEMRPEQGTPEYNRMPMLAAVVERYEAIHFPDSVDEFPEPEAPKLTRTQRKAHKALLRQQMKLMEESIKNQDVTPYSGKVNNPHSKRFAAPQPEQFNLRPKPIALAVHNLLKHLEWVNKQAAQQAAQVVNDAVAEMEANAISTTEDENEGFQTPAEMIATLEEGLGMTLEEAAEQLEAKIETMADDEQHQEN